MAVVADIDNLDLVVEPYEWTPKDWEAVRQAIEETRREADPRLAEQMRQWLAQRRKGDHHPPQRAEG